MKSWLIPNFTIWHSTKRWSPVSCCRGCGGGSGGWRCSRGPTPTRARRRSCTSRRTSSPTERSREPRSADTTSLRRWTGSSRIFRNRSGIYWARHLVADLGVGLTLFLAVPLPDSAGADENKAILAYQQRKVVEQSKSLSTQPMSATRCPPCILFYNQLSVSRPEHRAYRYEMQLTTSVAIRSQTKLYMNNNIGAVNNISGVMHPSITEANISRSPFRYGRLFRSQF